MNIFAFISKCSAFTLVYLHHFQHRFPYTREVSTLNGHAYSVSSRWSYIEAEAAKDAVVHSWKTITENTSRNWRRSHSQSSSLSTFDHTMKDQIPNHSGLVFIICTGLNPPHSTEGFRFITSQPHYGRSPGIGFCPQPLFSISSKSLGSVIRSQSFSYHCYT